MVVPASVTHAIAASLSRVGLMFIPDVKVDHQQPRGILARYVCTACGFIDEHCEDPGAIPIGPEYMTDVVDFGADSPYR